MKTETYRGRKLKVRAGRKGYWGKMFITVNGERWTTAGHDEDKELDNLRRTIDSIGDEIDGDAWAAYWYAPGTYTICDEGLHPVALGGQCLHFTCIRKRGA